MAHEISIRADGRAEAFFGSSKPAWHGLGTVVANTPSSADAIELAGLNWEVACEPIFTADMQQIDGHKRTYRADTKATLGVVTDGYHVVQNAQAFAFVDGLLADGIVKYESAGALKGGRIVWLLAHMPGDFEVAAGDTLKRYVLLSTGHDGSRAVTVQPTTVRVVCANTLAMADRAAAGKKLAIRHTESVHDRMALAQRLLTEAGRTFDANLASARKLCGRQISDQAFRDYLAALYPAPAASSGDRTKGNHRKTVDAISSGYFSARTNNLAGISRTPWAAYNAVTEYIDHPPKSWEQSQRERKEDTADRQKRAENHFSSVLLGSGAAEKQSAFNLALELVA